MSTDEGADGDGIRAQVKVLTAEKGEKVQISKDTEWLVGVGFIFYCYLKNDHKCNANI